MSLLLYTIPLWSCITIYVLLWDTCLGEQAGAGQPVQSEVKTYCRLLWSRRAGFVTWVRIQRSISRKVYHFLLFPSAVSSLYYPPCGIMTGRKWSGGNLNYLWPQGWPTTVPQAHDRHWSLQTLSQTIPAFWSSYLISSYAAAKIYWTMSKIYTLLSSAILCDVFMHSSWHHKLWLSEYLP